MKKIDENDAAAPSGDPSAVASITIHVKFCDRKISVSLSPESTGYDLKSLLQPLTSVLPRCQKLICKGKVLSDSLNLKSLQITEGSKIMLIASQGLCQGDGPVTEDAASAHHNQSRNIAKAIARVRSKRWNSTGVAALSELYLMAVPDEVWHCAPFLRVLDVSKNSIQELPAKIGLLKSLRVLYLNGNDFSDEKVSWDGLSQLKTLALLSFDENKLTTLPPAVGDLISLRQLHIAKNKLTCLPDELGCLNKLQLLKAYSNRISSVPTSIGHCSLLAEIDLSSNLLVEIPESIGKLQNLKILYLSNNGLSSLPSNLFRMCPQLSTLSCRNTEITNDFLHQMEGWEDYDQRQRQKRQKLLELDIDIDFDFDVGSDAEASDDDCQ